MGMSMITGSVANCTTELRQFAPTDFMMVKMLDFGVAGAGAFSVGTMLAFGIADAESALMADELAIRESR